MMPATNTFEGRIRLKTDTEANWNAHPIVPLLGELIIYSADATHTYSRVKIGDGNTPVTNLPFIDAGTIDGHSLPPNEVRTYATRSLFPYPGEQNILYIDLSTSIIYCYTPASGYTQLSNFTYNIEKTQVSNITYWRTGSSTTLSCDKGILHVASGILPSLNYEQLQVVRNITKEVAE